jgi:arginyl-tRNA synthetase
MESYAEYLATLDQLGQELDQLSTLARKKADAVRHDDLEALNQVLKQEQAMSLAIRGLERRRQNEVKELGLSDNRLTRLAEQYPESMRLEAKEVVEQLQRKYQIYQSASEVARHTLECSLHEIERALYDWGATEQPEGAGYEKNNVDPPKQLRTDIRA